MLKRYWIYFPVCLLLAYNATFFVLKNAQALSNSKQRTSNNAETFIQQYIPAGSKVIGEPLYYYAVTKAGSDFQYLNLYEDLEVREQFHREVYDYDFLLLTDHLKMRDSKGCIEYYMNKSKFDKIATFKLQESERAKWISELQIAGIPLLSNVEKHGYNCIIYKRVK